MPKVLKWSDWIFLFHTDKDSSFFLTKKATHKQKIRKTSKKKKQNKKKKAKATYIPSYTIIEDAITHKIIQMTSISKAYILCCLVTILKRCHTIAWHTCQNHDGGR